MPEVKKRIYTVCTNMPKTSALRKYYISIWKYCCKHFKIDKIEITGNYVREATAEDKAQAEREAERQKPRFSPEGKEYVKRNLPQVAGEVAKSANYGKTLFFETSGVIIKEGVTTGQFLITDSFGSNSHTIMYYYDRIPFIPLPTILYRVEISQSGFAKYTIDGFRE